MRRFLAIGRQALMVMRATGLANLTFACHVNHKAREAPDYHRNRRAYELLLTTLDHHVIRSSADPDFAACTDRGRAPGAGKAEHSSPRSRARIQVFNGARQPASRRCSFLSLMSTPQHAQQPPLGMMLQSHEFISICCARRNQKFAPELWLFVPPNTHHLRASSRDDSDTLHRQRRDAPRDRGRHTKHHVSDPPILPCNLPGKHQRFQCKALPSQSMSGANCRSVRTRHRNFLVCLIPPRLISETDINNDKWKCREPTPRFAVQAAPEIPVGREE